MGAEHDEETRAHRDAVGLLKLLQVDYQEARKRLEDVSAYFGEREATVDGAIRSASEAMEQGGESIPGMSGARRGVLAEAPDAKEVGQNRAALLALPPRLEVRLLGTFEAGITWGTALSWRSAKAKAVLKHLVVRRRKPTPRETLLEALWPGCEPSLANNSLRAAVRSLRQTLSSGRITGDDFQWIVFQDASYLINPQAVLWVDVDEFRYRWALARLLQSQGKCEEAVGQLKSAEALYRGDYLEEDVYEDWTTLRRESLKDSYLDILGRLAEDAVERADHGNCIAYCQKILLKDSCREDAYRHLICSYSRLGERHRAIQWYLMCEKTIQSELNVGPSQQTAELYESLLKGKPI
jgi:LuxR family maltose regulon positive regulatory protein